MLASKRVIIKNQNLMHRNGSFAAIKQEQLMPYWIRIHKCVNTSIQLGMQLWENGGDCWLEIFWMHMCEGKGQVGLCSGEAMPCPTHPISLGLIPAWHWPPVLGTLKAMPHTCLWNPQPGLERPRWGRKRKESKMRGWTGKRGIEKDIRVFWYGQSFGDRFAG